MKRKDETLLKSAAGAGLGAAIRATEAVLGSLRAAYRRATGHQPPVRAEAVAAGPVPAVPVETSVTSDYIVCLEDGRRFKMLKGHLRAAYGLSPREYREKWNLPADYPMVAPNYREKRARMAKDMGLGHMRSRSTDDAADQQAA